MADDKEKEQGQDNKDEKKQGESVVLDIHRPSHVSKKEKL